MIPSKQEVVEVLSKCNTLSTPSKEVVVRAAAFWGVGWGTVYAWQKEYAIRVMRGVRSPQVSDLPGGGCMVFARKEVLEC